MEIQYETLYFNFQLLKKKCKNYIYGNIKSLPIDIKILEQFQHFGLILLENNNYLFLNYPEKTSLSIDLYYYFSNSDKLHKIFHPDLQTRFFIHHILFNVLNYISPEKLINKIKQQINNNNNQWVFEKMKINNDSIIQAHNLLLASGLIVKEFCIVNQYFEVDGVMVIMKDTWYFKNDSIKKIQDYEMPVDFMQKIALKHCMDNL